MLAVDSPEWWMQRVSPRALFFRLCKLQVVIKDNWNRPCTAHSVPHAFSPPYPCRKKGLKVSAFPWPLIIHAKSHISFVLNHGDKTSTEGPPPSSWAQCDLPPGTRRRRHRGSPGSLRGWGCCCDSTRCSGGGCKRFLGKMRPWELNEVFSLWTVALSDLPTFVNGHLLRRITEGQPKLWRDKF